MASHGNHEPIPQEALDRDHEQRDLSIGMLAASLVGLTVLTGAAIIAMALMLGFLQDRAERAEAPARPVGPADPVPPQPRLERTPAELRLQHEANVEWIMGSYGWLERDASVARIPVDRAMEIVAREGLPILPDVAASGSETEGE